MPAVLWVPVRFPQTTSCSRTVTEPAPLQQRLPCTAATGRLLSRAGEALSPAAPPASRCPLHRAQPRFGRMLTPRMLPEALTHPSANRKSSSALCPFSLSHTADSHTYTWCTAEVSHSLLLAHECEDTQAQIYLPELAQPLLKNLQRSSPAHREALYFTTSLLAKFSEQHFFLAAFFSCKLNPSFPNIWSGNHSN